MKNNHGLSHRGVIDPDAYVGSIEADMVDNRLGEIRSTVRPFDRQRQNVRRVRRTDPVWRPTIQLAPRVRPVSDAVAARIISSARRPVAR